MVKHISTCVRDGTKYYSVVYKRHSTAFAVNSDFDWMT